MRNKEKHRDKFVRPLDLEKMREGLEEDEEWCSREDAKEVIGDLTDEEFEVVKDVLGHLFILDEKFPTEKEFRELASEIAEFLEGKTIKKVGWTGWSDEEPLLYLEFTDGTFLEMSKLVHIPGAILYDWGKEEEETQDDSKEEVKP